MQIIDLSGKYTCYSSDGKKLGTVKLPGSSCEGCIGKKTEYYKEYSNDAVKAPREKYEYVGELIYEKTFELPKGCEDKDISLFFERVNIASKVEIDGVFIGRGVISLTSPHVYRLTDRNKNQAVNLLPGRHTLRLHIDNTDFLHIGDMASGYSLDTQGHWNGVAGLMEIRIANRCSVESVQVYPDKEDISLLHVKTITLSERHEPLKTLDAVLKYTVKGPDKKTVVRKTQKIELFSRRQSNRFDIRLPKEKTVLWDEFCPALYEISVSLCLPEGSKEPFAGSSVSGHNASVHDFSSPVTAVFGLRNLSVKNRQFKINGKPLALRGTVNCAQFPLTGYPPTDTAFWSEYFGVCKNYGMNHVRFHAFCPPEAAFSAADESGIYLTIEMPLWLNRDVTPYEFGEDEWQLMLFRDEAFRISEAYGNHPSFCFFSNGNENLGDYSALEEITESIKAHDNRHLYTLTSNFDHPLSPAEDYLSAFRIYGKRIRIQELHDEVANASDVNYDAIRKISPAPFISFEVGQYCVYPDVDVCEKYTGNMLPVNFDVIRKEMQKKGVYDMLPAYISASGDLAAKLYKEDIEAVLRTRGMGGFELLSLTDYTGQSTATVGILDIFNQSKGILSSSEWRSFCSEAVPLFEAKRIFTNDETLNAELSLYDFSQKPFKEISYILTLIEENGSAKQHVYAFSGKAGQKVSISLPLNFIKKNTRLTVMLSAKDGKNPDSAVYTNNWRIFVYDKMLKSATFAANSTKRAASADTFAKALETGQKVPVISTPKELKEFSSHEGFAVVLPGAFENGDFSKNSFIPVFWSPVFFPSKKPCGAMIDNSHAALSDFPSDVFPDYEWKYLFEHSVSLAFTKDFINPEAVIEMVPNFGDNVRRSPLFTADYGKAHILFCGFDLDGDDITAGALRNSLASYIKNRGK